MFEWLSSRDIWLPRNCVWPPLIKNRPDISHLYTYPIAIAFLLYIVRCLFEKFVAVPIGNYFCIKSTSNSIDTTAIPHSQILEAYFKKCTKPAESIKRQISIELNLSYEQIDKWFKQRLKFKKPDGKTTPMSKFSESAWRFVFYLSIFIYGVLILFGKTWFWQTENCWLKYPNHELEVEIFWYYMIELGFYCSLIVSQFFDVKRKDFKQMFLHHVITISLMSYSYLTNFTRIGSLILVLHDGADFWLELAKVAKYANIQRLCDSAFIIFALVWFVTRLVAFPIKILYTTTFEGPATLGHFPAYDVFNFLLFILQIMHIIWFYMICKVAYKAIAIGKVDKDDRSESDESSVHEKQN